MEFPDVGIQCKNTLTGTELLAPIHAGCGYQQVYLPQVSEFGEVVKRDPNVHVHAAAKHDRWQVALIGLDAALMMLDVVLKWGSDVSPRSNCIWGVAISPQMVPKDRTPLSVPLDTVKLGSLLEVVVSATLRLPTRRCRSPLVC